MGDSNNDDEDLLQTISVQRKRSVAGEAILRVNSLLKKPTIEAELSEELDKYLAHLRNSGIYLANGIFTTNFAEGALLLQSGSALFAKKVDLLWEHVTSHHERIISYEEKTEQNETEFNRVEERKQRFKRKRKPELQQPSAPPPREQFTNIQADRSDFNNDDLLKLLEGDEPALDAARRAVTADDVVTKTASHITNIYSIHNYNVSFLVKEINAEGEIEPMHDVSETMLHRYHEYDARLQLEEHKKRGGTVDNFSPFNPLDHTFNVFLLENQLPIEALHNEAESFKSFYEEQISNFQSCDLNNLAKKLCPRRTSVMIERLPEEITNSYTPENELVIGEFEQQNGNKRKTIDSHSDIDSGFCDAESIGRQSELQRLTPYTPNALLSPTHDLDDSGIHSDISEIDIGKDASEDAMAVAPSSPDVSAVLPKTIDEDQACSKTDENQNVTVTEEVVQKCAKIRKRKSVEVKEKTEPVRQKRAKLKPIEYSSVTTELRSFEMFYSRNYDPQEGEGEVVEFDDDHFDDGPDTPEPLQDEPSITSPATPEDAPNTPEPVTLQNAPSTPEPVTPQNGPSTPEPITTPGEETAAETVPNSTNHSPTVQSSTVDEICDYEDDQYQESYLRYTEWKNFITKKIGSQKESDFDIHEEGSKIIDFIGSVGESVQYKLMCHGKTSAEVTHSFIAMLQLANTGNVDIVKRDDGKLANDTLEVKLLSTVRHHENLCEYQAPSEVTFEERLKKAKKEVRCGSSSGSKKSRPSNSIDSDRRSSSSYNQASSYRDRRRSPSFSRPSACSSPNYSRHNTSRLPVYRSRSPHYSRPSTRSPSYSTSSTSRSPTYSRPSTSRSPDYGYQSSTDYRTNCRNYCRSSSNGNGTSTNRFKRIKLG